jgi:hypothetical protein
MYTNPGVSSVCLLTALYLIAITIAIDRHLKQSITIPTLIITPKGQSKMDNPEKLATYGTQDTRRRQTKQKHYTQTNTNNVNETQAKSKNLKL